MVPGRRERGGGGLIVEGKLRGNRVQLLIDTGASVNLISLRWWQAYGGNKPMTGTEVEIYAVDGRPMDLRGEVCDTLRLGEREVPVVFVVAEMGNEAILGAPFLRKHGLMVDVAKERIMWTTEPPMGMEVTACRVVSARPAVVEGGTETFIEGIILGRWPTGTEGLVEPVAGGKGSPAFLVGRGLIRPEDDRAMVRILNPGKEPVVIYKNMTLASLEEVCPTVAGRGESAGGSCRVASADYPPQRPSSPS